jgi:hypothetical protein
MKVRKEEFSSKQLKANNIVDQYGPAQLHLSTFYIQMQQLIGPICSIFFITKLSSQEYG